MLALAFCIGRPVGAQPVDRLPPAVFSPCLQCDEIRADPVHSSVPPERRASSSTSGGACDAADAPATQAQTADASRQRSVASWNALRSRLKKGDIVSVGVTKGDDIVGTFEEASESSLTVAVAGQSRTVPAADVEQVIQRRGKNRLGRGLLIGVPLGALFGSGACYRDNSPPPLGSASGVPCGAAVLTGMAIGGGVGALIGSRIWRPAVVYARPVSPGEQAEPVAPPTVVGPSESTESLSVLSSRIKPFETIYVRTASGQEVAGSFSHASETSLTMEVDGQIREIQARDIQQVRRRGPNRVKRGMLIGYLTGATIGLSVTMTSESSEKGTGAFLSLTAAGGAGLIWGALIGAFIHERPLVYPAPGSSVRIIPVVGPGHASVLAWVSF
jgi:hypothetical protein